MSLNLCVFFQDMAVATVYTNLGDEAVAHALNETQVKVVVSDTKEQGCCTEAHVKSVQLKAGPQYTMEKVDTTATLG